MTSSDRGILYAVPDNEGTARRFDAFGVTAQPSSSKKGLESSPIPVHFESALSYGQTRAAFESDFETRYVSWLLARHHGNISAAAREARMDRKHLHDLAKKHGLRGPGMTSRR